MPATATHRATHVRSTPAHATPGNSGGSSGNSGGGNGDGSRANGAGSGSSGGNGGGAGNGGRHPGPSSGGASQPSVSPQGIDEGATAVSHVAAHVGEAFADALPTAPLKEVGTRLAAHVGLIPKQGGIAQKHAVDRIGTALGAALISSAVAVERTPSGSSIPFFDPPGGKSGTIYLVLIAALLLGVAALLFREVRSALGLTGPRTGVRVADQRPRVSPRVRAEMSLARMRVTSDRSRRAFRRLSANAVSGVRSLF